MQEDESMPLGKPGRHKRLVLPGLFLVAVLVLAWAAYWWFHGRYFQSTDDAYVGGNVTVISPRVSGYVSKVVVKDNAYVHAGDPLVELDPADFEARRSAASARVQAAKAVLARLQAQTLLAQAEITRAEAEKQARRATLTFTEHDAVRYARLARRSAGTVQAAEQARSNRAQADAKFRAATSALQARRRQLAVIGAQITEARAALLQAQAELREALLDVSYTVIRAPADGYVGDRSARVGTFVRAGTQLMSLVPARGLWIDANFKEDQLAYMRHGQTVDVVADVDPDERITGHVTSLSPASGSVFSLIPAQNATGNFTKIVQRVPVRIALDGRYASVGVLRPGLSVTVTVDTQTRGR
jgi:membrane fusion protein (multidrug efflux system)